MKLLKTAFVSSLLVVSQSAYSAGINQFLYFGLGTTNNQYQDLNFSPDIDTTQIAPLEYKDTDSASGLKLLAGYQFNQYVAIESGFTWYGSGSYKLISETADEQGVRSVSTKLTGNFETFSVDIKAVGTIPVSENFFLKGSLGGTYWDNDYTFLSGSVGNYESKSKQDSGVSPAVAVGVGYGFNHHSALTLEYETTEIASVTTNSIAATLLLRF